MHPVFDQYLTSTHLAVRDPEVRQAARHAALEQVRVLLAQPDDLRAVKRWSNTGQMLVKQEWVIAARVGPGPPCAAR